MPWTKVVSVTKGLITFVLNTIYCRNIPVLQFALEEEEVWRAVLSWAKYQAGISLDKKTQNWNEQEKAAVCAVRKKPCCCCCCCGLPSMKLGIGFLFIFISILHEINILQMLSCVVISIECTNGYVCRNQNQQHSIFLKFHFFLE